MHTVGKDNAVLRTRQLSGSVHCAISELNEGCLLMNFHFLSSRLTGSQECAIPISKASFPPGLRSFKGQAQNCCETKLGD